MGNKVTIKSYKGFDRDLKCMGFQYEVGNEYTMGGDISCCNRGFHACENPLEVLNYYFLDKNGQMARFCEVEQSGKIDKESDNTKVCSSKIKIKAELSFGSLVKAGVEWLKEITSSSDISDGKQNDKGGFSAKIGSSGNYAQIGSSGNSAQIGSSGNSAQIGSSGNYAQIGSSGNYAQIGSCGNSAKIGSCGYSAQIGSSGDYAQIVSTGEDSVICCAGNNATVSAKQGSWITLSEWEYNNYKQRRIPKCVKTEYVDGERIKADTPYQLVNGEFIEVK